MKVSSINSFSSFKGYTNPFGADITLGDNSRFAYFCVGLNNDVTPDYTTYRKLKRSYGFPEYEVRDNFLAFSFCRDPEKHKMLLLNNQQIYSGPALVKLKKNIDKGVYKKEQYDNDEDWHELYKEEERWHMKVYTFLARITRNLAIDYEPIYNKKFDVNTQKLFELFLEVTSDPVLSATIVNFGESRKIPYQRIAASLNDYIARMMEPVLKI